VSIPVSAASPAATSALDGPDGLVDRFRPTSRPAPIATRNRNEVRTWRRSAPPTLRATSAAEVPSAARARVRVPESHADTSDAIERGLTYRSIARGAIALRTIAAAAEGTSVGSGT